jgi:lipopolysaccharide/colanic/teichoic acid biosynthesis glycosyltransferase
MLVLLSPLYAALALAVKITSRGPVYFRQTRVGKRGKVVEVLKFRSMWVNTDSDTQWDVTADERVTSIGSIMRKTSLDELPQLWNVVRGDMSLVGPRPERPFFVEQFKQEVPHYQDRHRVPVGLTGLAQVNGLRGDTSIDERAWFDNHYIDNWSMGHDLVILARTAGAVIKQARN